MGRVQPSPVPYNPKTLFIFNHKVTEKAQGTQRGFLSLNPETTIKNIKLNI